MGTDGSPFMGTILDRMRAETSWQGALRSAALSAMDCVMWSVGGYVMTLVLTQYGVMGRLAGAVQNVLMPSPSAPFVAEIYGWMMVLMIFCTVMCVAMALVVVTLNVVSLLFGTLAWSWRTFVLFGQDKRA